MTDGQWNIPKLRELLEDVLPRNHAFEGFEVSHDFPAVGRKTMLLNVRKVIISIARHKTRSKSKSESKSSFSWIRRMMQCIDRLSLS